MKFTTSTILLPAFLATTFAAPLQSRGPNPKAWNIGPYSVSCTSAGCSYSFGVSVPANEEEAYPSSYVSGTCNGDFGSANFTACDNSSGAIEAKVAAGPGPGQVELKIKHLYIYDGRTYIVSTNGTIPFGAPHFDLAANSIVEI